ncbi:hypothetical protein PtA15_17A43 [Puccinia triticina]|uniref:Uncharacterized protein n=1 Tax=Puccinia triticina TaxID=208348 RepID=A0ABY7DC95_9BASI|nr:uncharacterized protein PtA15_17A43 [Puccinia triticina]WAQ92562.1 hypothetical protein PtA15_17A43 [Puccinia triticina]
MRVKTSKTTPPASQVSIQTLVRIMETTPLSIMGLVTPSEITMPGFQVRVQTSVATSETTPWATAYPDPAKLEIQSHLHQWLANQPQPITLKPSQSTSSKPDWAIHH